MTATWIGSTTASCSCPSRCGWIALFALLAGGILQLYAESTPLQPVLRSAWLGIHVSFIVMAYTLFAFLAVNGGMALCLPSRREALMRQSLRLLRPAEGLLGLGIFMGAVWA
ncbi:MAG: cytochrome c biogenesis protein CcsA, partial [Bacteroides sp.]